MLFSTTLYHYGSINANNIFSFLTEIVTSMKPQL